MRKRVLQGGLVLALVMACFVLVMPGYTQTFIKSLTGAQDLALATGGTGAAETFTRTAANGLILTLNKIDASHLKFRTAQDGSAKSVESLVDGSKTVHIKPKDIDTGAITGTTIGGTTITGTTLVGTTGNIGTLNSTAVNSTTVTATNLITTSPVYNVKAAGAVGDGTTDDTAALTAAVAACPAGGTLYFPLGIYKTTGLLITKNISLVTDAPPSSYSGGSGGAMIKAAGSQAYVVKFQGNHGYTDSFGYVRPYIRNISINGNSGGAAVISDAALVMETCFNLHAENFSIQDTNGHGVRLRNIFEARFVNPFILNCGTINAGSAWLIDGPAPFNADYLCNNISIFGGTWSANRGRWLDVSSLAGIDDFWIENNKFESDTAILNTVSTDVIHIGAASRTQIIHNTFANFGVTSNNYQNLIYINGDPGRGSSGGSDNLVMGNQAVNIAGNGAINGLYLDTNCPTVVEKDNVFRTGETARTALSNVNVSVYPQLIGKYWRTVSGSIFSIAMPSNEWPGYISTHQLTRSTSTAPFAVDANCVNDAGTVLKLTTANQVLPEICALQDLTRWIGHSATNLVIRVRMRLDAAGSVTVLANPSSPGYNPVYANGSTGTVNSTSWKWYTFTCPINTILPTTGGTGHLLSIFFWAVNTGTPNLLVDGLEFSTS